MMLSTRAIRRRMARLGAGDQKTASHGPPRRWPITVRTIAQVAMVATFAALTASFTAGASTTAPTSPPNPWEYQMTDPNNDGLVIHGVPGSLHNLSTWFDAYGNPVAAVGQVGGFSVFGDSISTFAPGNIFKPEVQLHDTGGVTLSTGGPTLNGGASAPAGTCAAGSFYFRTNTTAWGQRIYECESGRWVGIV
jgi:hypothetical protein